MQNQNVQQKASRVLLADSHQDMLEGIRSLLETVFEVVVMVADQKSLLDSLDKISPDLVVVDLSLPGTQETNIVRLLKSLKPELRSLCSAFMMNGRLLMIALTLVPRALSLNGLQPMISFRRYGMC